MELTNASMEVSLETTRNQLIIAHLETTRDQLIITHLKTTRNQLIVTEWQAARGAQAEGDLAILDHDNKYLERPNPGDVCPPEEAKALEVSGEGGRGEPQDVSVAREELKVLQDEKHKTQRVIATLQTELQTTQGKTHKLAEMIPMRVSGADQQEVVRLLCRVHQLEIVNMEAQSASLQRDFQIKRRDMVIARLHHHHSLSHDIIQRQRDLLEEHSVYCPKDLEDLYELYHKEREELTGNALDFGHVSPLPSIPKALPGVSFFPAVEGPEDEKDKVFTRSAKSKHLRRSQVLSQVWKDDLAEDDSHFTPLPPAPSRQSKTSYEDREVIASNTRSIAALAARKRNRVLPSTSERPYLPNPNRALYRPQPSEIPVSTLTSSILAQYDQLTGEGYPDNRDEAPDVSDDNLSLEKTSVHTDPSLPALNGGEAHYRARKPDPADDNLSLEKTSMHMDPSLPALNGGEARYRARKPDPADDNRKKGGYSEQYARTQARKNVPRNGRRTRGQEWSNRLYPDENRHRAVSPGRRRNVRPRQRNQAAVNGAVSDSSAVSTPQTNGHKPAKKPLPTIPQYRRGDITVTGQALPK
ncbi:hypothetical protein ACOMHN_060422 [Nucella lapillus]